MKNTLLIFAILFSLSSLAQNDLKNDKAFQKKYRKAIEKFNRETDSASADFYYKRGGIRQDYLDNQTAITDYDKAAALKPDDFKIYYNRGLAKLDLGLFSNAIDDFDKSILLNPNQAAIYNNRGISKSFLEDHAGAIDDYTLAIKLNANDAGYYHNRAISYVRLQQIDKACDDFYKADGMGHPNSKSGIKINCEKK